MKLLKIGLLATMVLVSCSSTQSVPATTTPPTTKPTAPTTVAPIDYGSDCKLGVASRDTFITLSAEASAFQYKYDEDRTKSPSEMLEAHYALTDAYRDLRSHVRNLEMPLLDTEQRNLVDAIQDYVDGLNSFLESDGRDLSVNDYIIPLSDATADFNKAFYEICTR